MADPFELTDVRQLRPADSTIFCNEKVKSGSQRVIVVPFRVVPVSRSLRVSLLPNSFLLWFQSLAATTGNPRVLPTQHPHEWLNPLLVHSGTAEYDARKGLSRWLNQTIG